jgi:hypothetical protein
VSRRGYAPSIGNVSEREWEAPSLVNRLLDQAQMRQAEESCPRHPNSHGQVKLLGFDGQYRWRWTCCGREV